MNQTADPQPREEAAEKGASSSAPRSSRRQGKSLSMHEGVAVWCDCCSCEAEPYWAELAEEMGIDLDPGHS